MSLSGEVSSGAENLNELRQGLLDFGGAYRPRAIQDDAAFSREDAVGLPPPMPAASSWNSDPRTETVLRLHRPLQMRPCRILLGAIPIAAKHGFRCQHSRTGTAVAGCQEVGHIALQQVRDEI